ncbi:MAG TPA: hypothetical protein ENJ95_12100 [Bacteroidetes bacterium]|nr:hypothetical protein [Bacteroidota bacterium]
MRRTSLLITCFFVVASLKAQYLEVGTQLGLSNYSGDLSEQSVKKEGFGSMIGIFGRYNFTKYLSAKASLTKGAISGSDSNAKSTATRKRNLNFRSDIIELSATGEINLSPFNIRAEQTGVPYFFTGFALAHFNPQAQMRGSWYDLQPLQLEGKKYSKYAFAIPFGLGMKFNLTYKINFGLEFGARKTFTDYLDDVSAYYPDVISLRKTEPVVAALAYRSPELTGEFGDDPMGTDRGNPNNKDWYFFGGLTISVNLTDKYGLDFDEKYEVFKEHPKPSLHALPKEGEFIPPLSKRHKKRKYQQRHKKKLFKRKSYLKPVVKKRSH